MSELLASQSKPVSVEQPIYAINSWLLFSGICFIYLFFNWFLQTSVLTDEVFYHSLAGRVSTDKLATFLAGQHKARFLSYLFVPVTLTIKMSLVAFCLFAGLSLTSRKLPFSTLFKIVLFAESAFAASTLLKLLMLAFSKDITSLTQLESFAPLSLYSFFRAASVPAWLTFPLQTLDLFMVAYVLLLAAGLRFFLKEPFKKMLLLVLCSYGLGMLCLMIGFAFLIVSMTP